MKTLLMLVTVLYCLGCNTVSVPDSEAPAEPPAVEQSTPVAAILPASNEKASWTPPSYYQPSETYGYTFTEEDYRRILTPSQSYETDLYSMPAYQMMNELEYQQREDAMWEESMGLR